MNRLICCLLICFASVSGARAANIMRASVTLTNYPANGGTFALQGSTRTFTNDTTSSPSTLIQQTNSAAYSATNLINQLTAYAVSSAHYLTMSNATNVTIRGKPGEVLTVAVSAGWATVVYTTNTISLPTFQVRVPYTEEASSNQTYIGSELTRYISDKSTNAIATNSAALSNYVSTGPHPQWIQGIKVFTYGVGGTNAGLTNGTIVGARGTNLVGLDGTVFELRGGTLVSVTVTNAVLTNVAVLQGYLLALTNGLLDGTRLTNVIAFNGTIFRATNGYWTNGIADNLTTSNLVNRGNAISSPGTGANSEQHGTASHGYAVNAQAYGNGVNIWGQSGIGFGAGLSSHGSDSINLGNGNIIGTNAIGAFTQGFDNFISNQFTLSIGRSILMTNDFSAVISVLAAGSRSTRSNELTFAGFDVVTTKGGRLEAGSITNTYLTGTATNGGAWADTETTMSSLANGNNVAVATSATFVRLTAGPTAAFAICGIQGGISGRKLTFYNRTGQTMTMAHDSGVDPTAANRIYSHTWADFTVATNGMVTLKYSAAESRWGVESKTP